MYHNLSRVTALALISLVTTGLSVRVAAQEKEKDKAPFVRVPQLILTHAGAHAPVNAVAFSPDAGTLYVGGFDKQVRRYKLAEGKYVADGIIRVPIGPGNGGVVNALAVSPDGKWVAAAGRAPMRSEGWGTADDGIYLEARRFLPHVQADAGVIYLFDPDKPDGGKVIRGPRLGVRSLAFASPSPLSGPVVVATSLEYDDAGARVGAVRVFDVNTGTEIANRFDLPGFEVFPAGVAAWATGAKRDGLRVVVGWDKFGPPTDDAGNQLKDKDGSPLPERLLPSKLLVWDDPKPNAGGTSTWDATERQVIFTLAPRVKDGTVTELLHGGYDPKTGTGLHTRREGTTSEKLTDPNNVPTTPFGLAALAVPGHGDADALLIANGRDGTGLKYELRLRAKNTRTVAVTGCARTPSLVASPDGRFLAVAGFSDNRVEVHDAVALAGGAPKVQKLAGGGRGFDNVKFLEGEKVWVGRANEAPANGGVVLNLGVNERVAEPAKGETKVDAPPAGAVPKIVPPKAANEAWRVTVAVGGAEKTVTIPDGARPTAAALLPAKPAWDADLGPVLAVASFQQLDQVAQVTLFDPTDGKELFRFGGPTLPVRALAFSGSRALLAAAGDDGTVAVWSLKGLTRRYPAIDGLAIADVKGAVTVTKVREKTAAAEAFKVDDVIVSVADAKGVQVPVKTPLDFTNTVRGLTVGKQADVQLKRGAVKVAVGARVGFRQPLFTLWVDPVVKDGKHEWVGWAATGRYDASGKGGEDRIGWVSATGDPARPVAFAGANQYRKLFYTRDFIRLLVKHADYDAADRERPKPPEPTLVPTVPVGTPLGNRTVVRQKLTDVTFQLQQLDTTLDLDRAKLEWRVSGPTVTSAWTTEPFNGGSAKLDVSKHDWVRGEHRVTARLLETKPDGDGDLRVGGEVTAVVLYVPPAPALAVTIDGKEVANGGVVETMAAEVEIGATAKAAADPAGAAVAVGVGDEKPAALPRAGDAFTPRKVPLAKGETLVRVTAINAGAGATADEEVAVQVRVRRLEPKVVPKPLVGLEVEPGYDHRATATEPYVFSTPKVRLTATATGREGNPFTQFEWKDGNGDWKALKVDAKSAALAVDLPADGTDKEVSVRAKSKDSEFATASVTLRYEGLPEVGLNPPPAAVAVPELLLSGALKASGPRPFGVRVLVASARTGQTRSFDAQFDANRTTWQTTATLFPGENQLAYAVYFGARRVHLSEPLTAVKYVRAPVTVGSGVIDVGEGTSGNAALVVAAPPDAEFRELLVNGSSVRFRAAAPVRVFGAALWSVGANGATVNAGADRPNPVPAEVRTDDGPSAPVPLAVRVAPPKPVVIDPPVIRLEYQGKSFSPEQGLPPVGEAQFGFNVTVLSSAQLTRFEVSFGPSPNDALVPVGKATAADAKPAANGFELTASPAVKLRRGPANYVRIVAVNSGGATTVGFSVSYTPAPPRVVVDSIREPNGAALPIPRDGGPVTAERWLVEAEGRVLWDDESDPIARDRNLTVVFVANGVAHVPVAVAMPDPASGKRERRFKGKVFLNTLDPDPKARGQTKVRVELRSGQSPRAQETSERNGPEPATFVVQSRDPLREQRLHVVVIGVQVRKEEEPELIKRVIKAVGGEARSDAPLDRGGAFVRRDFAEAILYRPEFQHARQDQLTKLLLRVGEDIKKLTNEKGWMNDVVVVYYHGRDWVDPNTGRWLLDSAVTLDSPANRKRADDAIRLGDLPLTHGMPVAVLNVAGATTPTNDLDIDLAYMRVAWAKAAERGRLLDQFAEALAQQRRTFGGVAKYVDSGGGKTVASLPVEGAGGRVVGLSDNP